MSRGRWIPWGALSLLAAGWLVAVWLPFQQLAAIEPAVRADNGRMYPNPRPALAEQGRAVYVALGCAECHTRRVADTPADLRRWGRRRTVARDYLYDAPVLLGSVRLGPDLSNQGVAAMDDSWHQMHLYNPRMFAPDSCMPAYPALFVRQRYASQPSAAGMQLPPPYAPEPGIEVVPTPEARALVAFLQSFRADAPVFEAPLPEKPRRPQP